MRVFLMIVVLLMVQYKTFGQEILIQEDFEFYWPLEQYDIQGDWSLTETQFSRGLKYSVTSEEDFLWVLGNFSNYDSVYVECQGPTNYPQGCCGPPDYGTLHIEYSADSINWQTYVYPPIPGCPNCSVITWRGYMTINSQEFPYIRFYSMGYAEIDNLLVIGYTNNVSTNYCQFDTNGDGNIGAQDLLAFLEVYGTFLDCE